ncbi:hypothetical protein [Spirillospora sp. NBC_01491]|uniref:hypothetical protein n=1 Tax=Spirillospora sp. NBC_01491 TaxID=2976007 RepID=UPI002E36E36E|nr:hypothetical protein [Spirillospora sp. NBC_01491]
MTATILAFRPRAVDERLRTALEFVVRDAITSCVPAPLVRALRSPRASTVEMTVGGVPVEITVGAEPMSAETIVAEWRRLLADGAEPGQRLFVGYPPLELAHDGAA